LDERDRAWAIERNTTDVMDVYQLSFFEKNKLDIASGKANNTIAWNLRITVIILTISTTEVVVAYLTHEPLFFNPNTIMLGAESKIMDARVAVITVPMGTTKMPARLRKKASRIIKFVHSVTIEENLLASSSLSTRIEFLFISFSPLLNLLLLYYYVIRRIL